MDWKTMLAYISGSVDEELLLCNEYLAAENRILRDQIRWALATDRWRTLDMFPSIDSRSFQVITMDHLVAPVTTGCGERLQLRSAGP